MEKVFLKELNMPTRREVLIFLKRLWKQEQTPCPFCGRELVLLHKKAKKCTSDWQCRACDKVFRTLELLDELNQQMPD